jgi:hypothetical protein
MNSFRRRIFLSLWANFLPYRTIMNKYNYTNHYFVLGGERDFHFDGAEGQDDLQAEMASPQQAVPGRGRRNSR